MTKKLSQSTLQTKADRHEDLEVQQLLQKKEESDAIINNLRKTIRDMAKQMKSMENKMHSLTDGKAAVNNFHETSS